MGDEYLRNLFSDDTTLRNSWAVPQRVAAMPLHAKIRKVAENPTTKRCSGVYSVTRTETDLTRSLYYPYARCSDMTKC